MYTQQRLRVLDNSTSDEYTLMKCGSIYCNSNSNCNAHVNMCSCFYGWTNKNYTNGMTSMSFNKMDNTNPTTPTVIEYCTYKQKNQLTAFLLEATLSFGIGHYYSGNYIIAAFKMFSLLFSYCGCFSLFFILGCKKSVGNGQYTEKILFFVSCITCCCIYFLWQIIDIILYGMNYLKDENVMELANLNDLPKV